MTTAADATLPPVLLAGAGRMGGALLAGWRARGLAPSVIVEPAPTPGLARAQDRIVATPAAIPADFRPAATVLAIKPQSAAAVLPALGPAVAGSVVLSIMAGQTIAAITARLGAALPVVRAMPNTPAAIGAGITVACAGPEVTGEQRELCTRLLEAAGEVAWVEQEALLDPVTAVSGSGPAYVFLLAELLEQAALAEGIPPDLARRLARRTVAGSGRLLDASGEDAAALRRAVTSPGGTTERALAVLMAEDAWPASLRRAVAAAAARARELAG